MVGLVKTTALTLLAAAVFYAGTMTGTALTLRQQSDAALEVASKHGERDAFEQVRCAMAVTWAERWHGLALTAVEAKYGPLTMESE